MPKLLIATHNQGKFKEIKNLLQDLGFKLVSLKDLKIKEEVEENGKTFIENAIIKAKFYGKKTGLLTLAGDAGLKVKALKGKPGVKSKRYIEGSDEERNKKILGELRGIPWEKRGAGFVSMMALFDPKKNKIWSFKGRCEGKITFKPEGKHGFGYDPIFLSDEVKKTFAQLTTREKNKISHRGQALRKVYQFLKRKFKNV